MFEDEGCVLVSKGKVFLSVLRQVFGVYISICKRKIFSIILMPTVICVHFSHLVDHCVTYLITLLNILMS